MERSHTTPHANGHSNRASEKDSRERLLTAAAAIFARKGFDKATVKELADAAGVNVSLVSYYFGGKEGLFRACLEQVGTNRLVTTQRILTVPRSLEDFQVRLRLYIEEWLAYHVEHRDVCAIIQRECTHETASPLAREVFREVFLRVFDTLQEFFRSAQKSGILRQDIDAQVMSFLFFGSLMSLTRFDHVTQEYFGRTLADPKFREKVTAHAADPLIEGFLSKSTEVKNAPRSR